MKVIVERIQGGPDGERLELAIGDEVEFDDSWYAVRIVDVVDDDGDAAHCVGCGNDDGPSWCAGVVKGYVDGVT